MAWQNYRLLWHGEQLRMNGRCQLVKAAIGKVRAANAAGKQNISAKHDPRRTSFPNKHDVAARMSGRLATLILLQLVHLLEC